MARAENQTVMLLTPKLVEIIVQNPVHAHRQTWGSGVHVIGIGSDIFPGPNLLCFTLKFAIFTHFFEY